jgi:hypothetical protein
VALASAKVVVGDSCFGGRPNYVSDRYYETRGRGGFLLHPWVEGVDHHGVEVYGGPTDMTTRRWRSRRQIDYYLERRPNREENRRIGFEWVRDNETYTQRAAEILDTVFPCAA